MNYQEAYDAGYRYIEPVKGWAANVLSKARRGLMVYFGNRGSLESSGIYQMAIIQSASRIKHTLLPRML